MKSKKSWVVLLMVCFVFTSLGIQAFAVEIGDRLPEPEDGWRRYDDENSLIELEGNWLSQSAGGTYNGSISYNGTLDDSFKFSFHGTKFRIITCLNHNRSNNIIVKVDGSVIDNYSEYITSGDKGIAIAYEKTGLSQDEHTVEIINNTLSSNKYFSLDAIDIDEDGKLIEYKEPIGNSIVLDIEPEKEKIKVNEIVTANLVIDNISKISAEDIRIDYDEKKLEFLGFEEVDGMKLVKSVEKAETGDLRVIVASKGEANIIDSKKILLKLKFKGIKVGDALVDITKGRVTDGIDMEKDLADKECDQGTIIIEAVADVNNSGEFTLLDLGIDARHFSKDPASSELTKYNTDIVVNGQIDDEDLLEIGKLILENSNYDFNE
ncbi:MAG: cohesin domain-containing protein [Maledivibacter sp.]|jgi:hypothetical protein|nr:cohesin domain-containing protein [Maledivibacter sp.]